MHWWNKSECGHFIPPSLSASSYFVTIFFSWFSSQRGGGRERRGSVVRSVSLASLAPPPPPHWRHYILLVLVLLATVPQQQSSTATACRVSPMELPLGGPALRHYTQSRPRPHRQKLNYRPSRPQVMWRRIREVLKKWSVRERWCVCEERKWKGGRDVIGYRGERQGEGNDVGGVLWKMPSPCLIKAVPLYRSPAVWRTHTWCLTECLLVLSPTKSCYSMVFIFSHDCMKRVCVIISIFHWADHVVTELLGCRHIVTPSEPVARETKSKQFPW